MFITFRILFKFFCRLTRLSDKTKTQFRIIYDRYNFRLWGLQRSCFVTTQARLQEKHPGNVSSAGVAKGLCAWNENQHISGNVLHFGDDHSTQSEHRGTLLRHPKPTRSSEKVCYSRNVQLSPPKLGRKLSQTRFLKVFFFSQKWHNELSQDYAFLL